VKVHSDSFEDGQRIPERYAFGKHDPSSHVALSDSRDPHLAGSDLPAGTKSIAVIVHDPDVPSVPDDVNQEGKKVAADLPRVDFFHWVLVDLAPEVTELAEGVFAEGVTVRGKAGPEGPHKTRQGLNNYTQWFEGDAEMAGSYYGYDGPCPPWNDERVHRYYFTVYALDVERAPIEGDFTGPEVLQAIDGHVLAKASIVGTYAIYPDAK